MLLLAQIWKWLKQQQGKGLTPITRSENKKLELAPKKKSTSIASRLHLFPIVGFLFKKIAWSGGIQYCPYYHYFFIRLSK